MAMADEIEQRARQIEALAAELHGLYQAEAHRQGDVRHPDEYDELPERLKEYDRELARFVLEQTADAEARVKELEVALQGSHDAAAYSKNELTQERDQAQADLAALKEALDDVLIGLNNILPSLVGHKEIILTKHPMPCRNLDFCIVRDAERRLERNQHVLDQSHPGTALLQERDRLRALLMLAYDELIFRAGHYDTARLILTRIAEAVSPVGYVKDSDVQWAREQLQKGDTP